jgi:MbtH protein
MDEEDFEYQVLVNHEEQYSLWPIFKAIPTGWRQVGPIGDKQDCLAYVESVWTDMRPLSLRRSMSGV